MNKNPYLLERLILKALKLKFPDAKVTDQQFNLEFQVDFPNGEIGYAGICNGPVECDMYKSEQDMSDGNQPYDSVSITPLWDRIPCYYEPDGWVMTDQGTLYNESAGFEIIQEFGDEEYRLEVMIDRSEYIIAKHKDIAVLQDAAMNYIWMLSASELHGLIDAPDIIFYPLTNQYRLADCDFGWNEKRPFKELLDILYGTYEQTI